MMPVGIVHCPSLGRDLSPLLAAVPQAFVVDAPLTPGRHVGCIAGHRAIVSRAEREGWPYVGVLEDDCAFTGAFDLARWEADAAWTAAHGYGVLAGGCVSTRNARKVRDGLVTVERFKSTHCVVYTKAAYPIVHRLTFPMDVQLGRLGAKCLVTVPFIALQCPGYSGIQQEAVDYRPMYARHEAFLEAVAA